MTKRWQQRKAFQERSEVATLAVYKFRGCLLQRPNLSSSYITAPHRRLFKLKDSSMTHKCVLLFPNLRHGYSGSFTINSFLVITRWLVCVLNLIPSFTNMPRYWERTYCCKAWHVHTIYSFEKVVIIIL